MRRSPAQVEKMNVSAQIMTARFICITPLLFRRGVSVFLEFLVSKMQRFVEPPHLPKKQKRNPRRRIVVGDFVLDAPVELVEFDLFFSALVEALGDLLH